MSAKKKTVFVIYYSMYGHVQALAREVCKGLEKAGVNAKLFQIAETLPQEVLEKMGAPPKAADIPVITVDKLTEADGLIFGIPTRFGMLPAQVKALFDQCGQLWMKGALANKFVGTFFSTGSLAGGQETTALTCMPFFAHNGMLFVPIGTKSKILGDNSAVRGGSAYGAGCIATGPAPSAAELQLAEEQGFDFGSVVRRTNF
ncbi:unnamed protein product [Brachionus calyciflorus]|uniref:Flavodoxin-like domain-containing protein n=1 Tax=Brachionus calyciflorus TaxID=104777 RepID=A0A813XKL8_9BILA|nr:unnamed protein product [Brachionus calyciflorus]